MDSSGTICMMPSRRLIPTALSMRRWRTMRTYLQDSGQCDLESLSLDNLLGHISPHWAMITSRLGLSRSEAPVRVFSILRATSMPSTTLPKTTCLLFRKGVATVVMKNWQPLVLGPEFWKRVYISMLWVWLTAIVWMTHSHAQESGLVVFEIEVLIGKVPSAVDTS
jgi:hypothetical protein